MGGQAISILFFYFCICPESSRNAKKSWKVGYPPSSQGAWNLKYIQNHASEKRILENWYESSYWIQNLVNWHQRCNWMLTFYWFGLCVCWWQTKQWKVWKLCFLHCSLATAAAHNNQSRAQIPSQLRLRWLPGSVRSNSASVIKKGFNFLCPEDLFVGTFKLPRPSHLASPRLTDCKPLHSYNHPSTRTFQPQ